MKSRSSRSSRRAGATPSCPLSFARAQDKLRVPCPWTLLTGAAPGCWQSCSSAARRQRTSNLPLPFWSCCKKIRDLNVVHDPRQPLGLSLCFQMEFSAATRPQRAISQPRVRGAQDSFAKAWSRIHFPPLFPEHRCLPAGRLLPRSRTQHFYGVQCPTSVQGKDAQRHPPLHRSPNATANEGEALLHIACQSHVVIRPRILQVCSAAWFTASAARGVAPDLRTSQPGRDRRCQGLSSTIRPSRAPFAAGCLCEDACEAGTRHGTRDQRLEKG